MSRMNQRLAGMLSSSALAILVISQAAGFAAESGETPVTQLISPDRKHIAYGQIAVGPNGEQKVRIIVGKANGSRRRALPLEAEGVDEVQWYGNDRIAYVTDHGEDGYRLIDLEGRPAGELRMPPGCDSFFHQCLSPDGRTIAFCGNYVELARKFESDEERRRYVKAHPEAKQVHGVFLVDLATQSVKQVLDQTVANLPSWSPDSESLAFGIGHYVKDYPLAIIERKTGRVSRPAVKGTAAAWSPDSSHLAIVTDIAEGGSWLGGIPMDGLLGIFDVAGLMESGDARIDRISDPPVNIFTKEPYSWTMSGSYGAVWSPDGKWLAYRHRDSSQSATKEKASREEIWLVRPDGTASRKVLNHGAVELAWANEHTLLWVNDGQFGVIDIEIDGEAALGPTPESPGNQFIVAGRVTDDEGRPMEGVEVRAATGFGTLRTGTPVKTDAAGWYELHCGPGIRSLDGGTNLQAATIYAHKPGFYERDLCQGGNLGMANYRPKDFDAADWHFNDIVYRGRPYHLDFVMLPAATVVVELVDSSGKPLANYNLELNAEELYPSSNVLAAEETNKEGMAEFSDVPVKGFWLSLGRGELRTEPVELSKRGRAQYLLTYDDIAGTLTASNK